MVELVVILAQAHCCTGKLNDVIPAKAHYCPGKILPVFGKPCVARFLNETGDFRLKFFKFPEPFDYAQDKPRPKGQEKFNKINETSATLSHLDSIKLFPWTVVGEGRYPEKSTG